MTVRDVPRPCQRSDAIVDEVLGLGLGKEVENSYLANGKKVCEVVKAVDMLIEVGPDRGPHGIEHEIDAFASRKLRGRHEVRVPESL